MDNLENKSIEELFTLAEEVNNKLDNPELSLEDSIATYKDGIKVVEVLKNKLDAAEKEVIVLGGNAE